MSKKTKTSTGPSKQALPYLQQASGALTSAYNGNAANISNIENTLQSNLPTVLGQTLNNPTTAAANSYDQDVLSGKYLGAGNPYLNQQIADTNQDVTNTVNGSLGTRGLAGGSAAAQILGRELAKNETNLRYTDYTNERANMNTAAGNAASLQSAQDGGISALTNYLTTQAGIPLSQAQAYASGIGSLWGNSTTTTQKNPLLPSLIGAAGSALGAYLGG